MAASDMDDAEFDGFLMNIAERKRGIDTILATLLPLHAGVPQVRQFLQLEAPDAPPRASP